MLLPPPLKLLLPLLQLQVVAVAAAAAGCHGRAKRPATSSRNWPWRPRVTALQL
jgi:hypothetical protein